jgi:hypothetical protein
MVKPIGDYYASTLYSDVESTENDAAAKTARRSNAIILQNAFYSLLSGVEPIAVLPVTGPDFYENPISQAALYFSVPPVY